MLPGGQQANILGAAQQALCDALRATSDDPNTTCQNLIATYYQPPTQNREIYDAWVAYGSARVYSNCTVYDSSHAGDGATCGSYAINSDPNAAPLNLSQYTAIPVANRLQKGQYVELTSSYYTYTNFFKKAKELALEGITLRTLAEAGQLEHPVPQSVLGEIDNLVNSLTGDDPNNTQDDANPAFRSPLVAEIIGRYVAAMGQVPEDLQSSPAVQEAVGKFIVDLVREAQQGPDHQPGTADDLSPQALLNRLFGMYIKKADVHAEDKNGNGIIELNETTINIEFGQYPVEAGVEAGEGGMATRRGMTDKIDVYSAGEAGAVLALGSADQMLGGEANLDFTLGLDILEQYKVFLNLAAVAYGTGEYFADLEGASFQDADGISNAFKLNKINIGTSVDIGRTVSFGGDDVQGHIDARFGLIGARFGAGSEVFSHNKMFQLMPVTSAGSSLFGLDVSYTHPWQRAVLTARANVGYGLKVPLWQDPEPEDVEHWSEGTGGVFVSTRALLHQGKKVYLTGGAGFHYPSMIVGELGIEAEVHKHVRLAGGGRVTHQFEGVPQAVTNYAAGLFAFFPLFKEILTPYIGATYGGRLGTVVIERKPVDDNRCVGPIGLLCEDSSSTLDYRGFSLDLGVDIKALSWLIINLGGNMVYGGAGLQGQFFVGPTATWK